MTALSTDASVVRDADLDAHVGGQAYVDDATGTVLVLRPAEQGVRRLVVVGQSADVAAWTDGTVLGWVAGRNGYATGTYALGTFTIVGDGARVVRSLLAGVRQVVQDAQTWR